MRPERAFFDLQVRCANAAARVANVPPATALLDWTNLYVRFGAGRAFDPAHPVWAAYIHGLVAQATVEEQCAWTWHYLQRCPTHRAAPDIVAAFGCFSYARDPHGGVRLHFIARVENGVSPLDLRHSRARRSELRRLIQHVYEHESIGAEFDVRGTSWLYHLPAYRRLFPDAYLASAKPVARLRALSLWGQFLDRHGALRVSQAEVLLARLERLERLVHIDDIAQCLPLPALAMRAPIHLLHEYFHE